MRKAFILTVVFFFLSSVYVPAQDHDSILGAWYTENDRSLVEIYQCDKLYCGKIVWLKYPKDDEGKEKLDNKNPDLSKRSNKLIGLTVLSGLKYDGNNEWVNGKIYDPKNGKTYSCKMSLDGNTLKIRGYIGFSLFGRTTVWTKKA
jgi:uncharacterized protein (DUF2147 family)